VFLETVEAGNWSFLDSDGAIMTKTRDIRELGDKTFVCKSASMRVTEPRDPPVSEASIVL
jgi:hypothetical protein